MNIVLTSLNYQFNADGSVNYVQANFSGNANNEFVNAQVKVTKDDLAGKDFATLTTADLQNLAGNKVKSYVDAAFTAPAAQPATPAK